MPYLFKTSDNINKDQKEWVEEEKGKLYQRTCFKYR